MSEKKDSQKRESKDSLEDLGRKLRLLREGQGFSLEDVERATHIRAHFIAAIEEGRFEDLPERVYTRGFIKSYCDFLSAPDLWERYKPLLSMKTPPVDLNVLERYTPPHKVFRRSSRFWIYLILILAIGGATFLVWEQRTSIKSTLGHSAITQVHPSIAENPQPPQVGVPTSGEALSSEPTQSVSHEVSAGFGEKASLQSSDQTSSVDLSWMDADKAKNAKPRAKAAIPSEAGVQESVLGLTADKPCWVFISQGGKVLYSGTMRAGDSKQFSVTSDTQVKLGNFGAAHLSWRGREITRSQGQPHVVTLIFHPDGTVEGLKP